MNDIKKKQENTSKKTYRSPELSVFGSISQLTKGGIRSRDSDHGNDMMYTS